MKKISDCEKELGYRPDFCACKMCKKSLVYLTTRIASNTAVSPLGNFNPVEVGKRKGLECEEGKYYECI